jgi:indolepyruvate decarboxylase
MYTVGSYLAARLSQIGLKHHFAVAGDYNLALLDELLKQPDLKQVYCSNELNCGFSAEGYARANGAAAAVVTFSVGALLAFNCDRRRLCREPAVPAAPAGLPCAGLGA